MKVIHTGGKHCGKRRNCSLQAFSPFPTVFFEKACFPGASKGVIVWEWVNERKHKIAKVEDNYVQTAPILECRQST